MKKRITAVLMAAFVLISSASAVQGMPRASKYLDSYVIDMIPNNDGTITVSYSVYGTGRMTTIGADEIFVEEQLSTGRWIPVVTYVGDDDPSEYYSYNAYSHSGSVDFESWPGVRYRATLTAYAGNSSGSDTGELESNIAVGR